MIFRILNDPSGSEPGLEGELQSLEQQAGMALAGFDAQFFNRAGEAELARRHVRMEEEALWGRVLRAALMEPEDLRDGG